MDLILVKPRAYRHFLYNLPFLLPAPTHQHQKGRHDQPALPTDVQSGESAVRAWLNVGKRLVALVLVDAYLRWFYLCAYGVPGHATPGSSIQHLFGKSQNRTLRQYSLPSVLQSVTHNLDRRALRQGPNSEASTMVLSYLAVWIATMAETVAFYGTVTLLSVVYVGWQRWRRHSARRDQSAAQNAEQKDEGSSDDDDDDDDDEDAVVDDLTLGPVDSPPPDVSLLDLYRPQLIPTALMLSSLSTLLLLSIVLLWESKLPRPQSDGTHLHHRQPSAEAYSSLEPTTLGHLLPSSILSSFGLSPAWSLQDAGITFSTDFAVRTLLGGLSAGVCLAVIHPRAPVFTTGLLLVGWYVESLVRTYWTLLPSKVGPGEPGASSLTVAETVAAIWYCRAGW
ncbi:unnamed protein product [Jaminaea pallidilutea]